MKTRLPHRLAAISRADRKELNTDLSKAAALVNAGKVERGQKWGGRLVQALLRLRMIKAE